MAAALDVAGKNVLGLRWPYSHSSSYVDPYGH